VVHPIVEKILFAGALIVLCLHFALWTLVDRREVPAPQFASSYDND